MNIKKELAALQRSTPMELRERYERVFGEPTRSGNKPFLIKRIAWRLQANAEGDLSERARQRAEELANDADLRLSPPKSPDVVGRIGAQNGTANGHQARDKRLPPPGSTVTRTYKGGELEVSVLEDGFEFEGERFKSLSAAAKAITGSHCNGYLFFGLTEQNSKESKR